MRRPSWKVSRTGALLGAALATAPARPSFADDRDARAIELGWRAGYALPAGDAIGAPGGQRALALGDVVTAALPLALEAGYRLARPVVVGAYVGYARALLGTLQGCPVPGVNCWASRVVAGAQAQIHALPRAALDPWAGLAVGYEVLDVDSQLGGGSLRGGEVTGQAGVDWRAQARVAIGPFVDVGAGWFLACTNSSGAPCTLPAIGQHEWVTVGLRAAFDLTVAR
jgi:hypothetical protein